jgi:hypothetical protein
VPAICYVANPYAKVENTPRPDSSKDSTQGDLTCMPSEEWRRHFLTRFTNMRESLAIRTRHNLPPYPDKIPRGRNGKKWYRFLHGRDLVEDVEYDDEQEEESDAEGMARQEEEVVIFQCREPSENLLHHFGTVRLYYYSSTLCLQLTSCNLFFSQPRIISLLSLLPYWLTQPHVSPETDQQQAIDPFHSRWLFALLAHLDSQLVGDDISVLRILARACIACIIQSRIQASSRSRDREEILQDEMGAWMIICAVAGIWAQHDLWQDGQDSLEQYTRMQ